MTPLELYVWTVKTLGVPSRVSFEDGRIALDGPFRRLKPAALKRVLSRAEQALSEAARSHPKGDA